jgi:hypothetical protein
MPYSLRKVPNKKCYRIRNRYTKRVFAKCTSLEKAKKQLRLLRAIEFNKSFKLLPKGQRPSDRKTRSRRN